MYMYIYLTTRVALTKTETLRILVSTVTGLVHLHTEIFGTQVGRSLFLISRDVFFMITPIPSVQQ